MADRDTSSPNTDGPANEPSPGEEFDAAVSEALGEVDGTPPDMGSVDGNDEEQTDSRDDGSAPAQDAPNGDDAAPALEEAPDGGTPAPPAQDTTDDIWANATPELKAAHEKAVRDEQHRSRTWEGRARSYQARIRELERGQPKRDQDGQDARSNTPGKDEAATGSLNTEALAKLRDDYSELGPVFDLLQSQQEKIETLSKDQGQIVQDRNRAEVARQEQILAQAHPDYDTALRDERFLGWLEVQPTSIREAFQRNFDAVVDGEDAALVVGKFKADVGFGAQAPAPTPTPSPTPAPTPAPSDKRRRQLESGRDAGQTGLAVSSGVPDDFEAAANIYLEAAEKR